MAWHGMTVEGSLTAHGTVSQSACTSGWLQAEPTTQEDWRSPPPQPPSHSISSVRSPNIDEYRRCHNAPPAPQEDETDRKPTWQARPVGPDLPPRSATNTQAPTLLLLLPSDTLSHTVRTGQDSRPG